MQRRISPKERKIRTEMIRLGPSADEIVLAGSTPFTLKGLPLSDETLEELHKQNYLVAFRGRDEVLLSANLGTQTTKKAGPYNGLTGLFIREDAIKLVEAEGFTIREVLAFPGRPNSVPADSFVEIVFRRKPSSEPSKG